MSSFARNRRRVVDASDVARRMRETFAARDVEYEEVLPFSWPRELQHVGDSLGVAYGSDKWKQKSWNGKREIELYKHIAPEDDEPRSRNRALARPKLFYDYYSPRESWPTIGPYVSFIDVPLPTHFAILGSFIEANLRLHVAGDDEEPQFGSGDDGVMAISLKGATLGASKIMWSRSSRGGADEPFLFVYTRDGVQMMIFGDELDIERDGIVG